MEKTKKLPTKSILATRLVPILFITYSIAYLDRANFSFGLAGGMQQTLKITPEILSILSAVFFLGYFIFQIPAAAYAEKKSAKKLVFWSMIIWGFLAIATGLVTNYKILFVIRFLLGVVESAVAPALIILVNQWFVKEERSRANTMFLIGAPVTILWMSIVSAYLIKFVGWQMMFIIEGLPPLLWAFLWWKLVEDKPSHAKWLTQDEKNGLENAFKEEQAGIKQVTNYLEAFKNPIVLLLCLEYFLWALGVNGLVMWLPSMVKSSGKSIVTAGWLSAIPYALATIVMLATSRFSDRTGNRKGVISVSLLIAAICFYGSFLAGPSKFWIAFILLAIAAAAMYGPYGILFALISEILPNSVVGRGSALVNNMGMLGGFAGAYFVGHLNGITGNNAASFKLMAGSLLLAFAISIVVSVKSPSNKKNIEPVIDPMVQ